VGGDGRGKNSSFLPRGKRVTLIIDRRGTWGEGEEEWFFFCGRGGGAANNYALVTREREKDEKGEKKVWFRLSTVGGGQRDS